MIDLETFAGRLEISSGSDFDLEREIHDACWDPQQFRDGIPPCTTSVDASSKYKVEGWTIQVTEVRFGMWTAKLWQGDKSVKMPCDASSIAPNEARARTAAWMRARRTPL